MEETRVTVTYEQLTLFRKNAEIYLAENAKDRNSFTHALSRVLAWTKKDMDDYNDKVYDIKVSTAIKNKDTGSFYPGLDVDPTKAIDRNTKLRNLLNTTISVRTYMATDLPDNVNYLHFSVFFPFVLDAEFPAQSPVQEAGPA